jgi:CheY-like chemotaxis protein
LRRTKEAKPVANILVVDDDRDLLKLVQTVLTRAGHTVTLAMNGQEALDAALSDDFDLAVVDVMMPVMDGYELTRRLRAHDRTRHMPILILTARTQVADQMLAANAGADGYLGKPLSYKDLTDKARQLIEAAAARQAPPQPEHPAPEPALDPSRVFILQPTSPAATLPPSQPASPLPPATGATVAPFISPMAPSSHIPQGGGHIMVTIGLRGGAGVTTVAVTLAGALLRAGKRVCLADLSPNGGQVARHLHLRPNFTWGDWHATPESKVVGQTLIRHSSGLFVLAAPVQPVRHGLATDTLQTALGVMRGFFTDIVIDAAPVLDDATCTALMAAQNIFVVFNPETGAARTALNTLRAMVSQGVPAGNVRLILNQNSPEPPISIAEVEKILGRPADWAIPYDRSQAAALAQEAPLAFSQPSTPLVAAVSALTLQL